MENFLDDLTPYAQECSITYPTRLERMNASKVRANALTMIKFKVRSSKAKSQRVGPARQLILQLENLQEGKASVGYFSLPGEVRNRIMRYALVPGTAHPNQTIAQNPTAPSVVQKSTNSIKDIGKTSREAKHRFQYLLWFARIPLGIGKFLIPQLFTFNLDHYLLIQTTVLVFGIVESAQAHRDVCIQCSAVRSWRDVTLTRVNHVRDHLLGRTSQQVLVRDCRPVPQLLATCKQAHFEGLWYYTDNIFYLPRGPLEYTLGYFAELTPRHLGLVQKVGIRLGFGDITAKDIDALESYFDCTLDQALDTHPYPRSTVIGWPVILAHRALQIWTAKLVFVRRQTTIKHLRLESAFGVYEFHNNLQISLRGVCYRPNLKQLGTFTGYHGPKLGYNVRTTLAWYLEESFNMLLRLLRFRVVPDGWKSTRLWLGQGDSERDVAGFSQTVVVAETCKASRPVR